MDYFVGKINSKKYESTYFFTTSKITPVRHKCSLVRTLSHFT